MDVSHVGRKIYDQYADAHRLVRGVYKLGASRIYIWYNLVCMYAWVLLWRFCTVRCATVGYGGWKLSGGNMCRLLSARSCCIVNIVDDIRCMRGWVLISGWKEDRMFEVSVDILNLFRLNVGTRKSDRSVIIKCAVVVFGPSIFYVENSITRTFAEWVSVCFMGE